MEGSIGRNEHVTDGAGREGQAIGDLLCHDSAAITFPVRIFALRSCLLLPTLHNRP